MIVYIDQNRDRSGARADLRRAADRPFTHYGGEKRPITTSVPSVSLAPPTRDTIHAAASFVEGRVVRTPLLVDVAASASAGRRVLVKAEVLQRTGSFKIRGALTFLHLLDPAALETGVVTYSSGNHAQAVAAAAAEFGVRATVVMPSSAPEIKRERTRGWGAEIVTVDDVQGERERLAAEVVAATGATLVPPYDHPWTIAGQATLGLELAAQCTQHRVEDPVVLVPTGGGGLCAGIALALEAALPGARVYSVEPEGWDDHRLSLERGERVRAPADAPTICDALRAPIPGEVPFSINRRLLAGGIAVTDDEVRAAMRHAFVEDKLVVEPGGAAGLAALLAGKTPGTGPVVVVLSGGNVDPETFAREVGAAG
jgi:threonine dehydratase